MSDTVIYFSDLVPVMARYHRALVAHETTINQLNVFPVPDGDTGTNMRSTIEAVLAALRDSPSTSEAIAHAISHASLLGARGNSGIILAQFLRAMTRSLADHETIGSALADHETIGSATFAQALREASDAARSAVVLPCEGTMLSVADAGADGAEGAVAHGEGLLGVVRSSCHSARDALWATPTQLPILARAGVVDAGGAGLTLLLGAFLQHMSPESDGGELPLPDNVRETLALNLSFGVVNDRLGHDDATSYEVMFLLDSDGEAMSSFRTAWAQLGDSVVIVGEEPTWNCHIHTFDIGAVIEAAVEVGRPYKIRVTDLDRQVVEEGWVERSLSTDKLSVTTRDTEGESAACAVVAVSTGAGLNTILKSLGVSVIVDGGPSMNPSTQEVLLGIELVSAHDIVLLPNNRKVFGVAHEAARLSGKHVEVLETRNVPEAIAVMLGFEPTKGAKENVDAMHASLQRVKTGEVTRAVRDAATELGAVAKGDFLAMDDRGVVVIGHEIDVVALGLIDAILEDEHEIVTLYRGVGTDIDAVEKIVAMLSRSHLRLAVEHFDGGQSHEQILVALE